ncbi:MAG: Carbonate dehydratase [Gemmatimonadetes bacterium]|nr:Carbonate dehydratase [Gemmatimonadota bacterium]
MDAIKRIFENNRAWVRETMRQDPGFFQRMLKGQSPNFLFIGCSDSRVPANVITGTTGGEMFVHRNVANQAIPSDLNMLAVLQYAVDVLKVPHVVVCGHYGCGGVKAALELPDGQHELVDQWLGHVRQVRRRHHAELASLDAEAQARRLVELNVIEQVQHLAMTSVVRAARQRGQDLHLWGWVYSIGDGLLHTLEVNTAVDEVPELARVGA